MLYQKSGPTRDFKQSLEWFKKAADVDSHRRSENIENCYEAQNFIGLIYQHGLGVSADPKLAVKWFLKSAKNGCQSGELGLALLSYNVQGIKISGDEIMECLKKLANEGNVQSHVHLGGVYLNSTSGAIGYKNAMYWFQKAARGSENPTAQYWIGIMYKEGFGVKKNEEAAFHWFKKSAKQGYPSSQHIIGIQFAKGMGTRQNFRDAAYWLNEAVKNNGNLDAQYDLAVCYIQGFKKRKKKYLGLELLKETAKQGNRRAYNDIKLLLRKGKLEQDPYSGYIKWVYKQVILKEDLISIDNIGEIYLDSWPTTEAYDLATESYTSIFKVLNDEDTKTDNQVHTNTVQRFIADKPKIFHVEDRRAAKEEPPKFFYVEDTSKSLLVEDKS